MLLASLERISPSEEEASSVASFPSSATECSDSVSHEASLSPSSSSPSSDHSPSSLSLSYSPIWNLFENLVNEVKQV